MSAESDPKVKRTKGRSHLQGFVDNFVQDAYREFHGDDTVYNQPEEPARRPTERQGKRLGKRQADQPNAKANAKPSAQPVVKAVAQPNDQTLAKAIDQAVSQPVRDFDQPFAQPVAQISLQQTPRTSLPADIVPRITMRQDAVLRLLYKTYVDAVNNGRTPYCNRVDLSAAAGLTYGSVHSALKALKRYKYYTSASQNVHISNYTGFIIELNKELCDRYFRTYVKPLDQPNDQTLAKAVDQPVRVPDQPVDQPNGLANGLADSSSSSSFFFNKTIKTTTIEEIMLQIKELEYWQSEPNVVTKRHIQDWLIKTKTNLEFIPLYLERCHHHMVELGKEKELDKPAINYFYTVLKASGSYPEYKGFMSREERRLEEERKILERKEKERADREALWLKTEFYKMMEDHDCELFRTCFSRITEFARKMGQENADSSAFHNSMFEEFKNIKYGIAQGSLFESAT